MTTPDAAAYSRLLSPITLRNGLKLRNRVVVTAHGTGLSRNGVPTPELVEYHRNRARGGAGLIITEHNSIHHTSRLSNGTTIESYSPRVVEPYRLVTEAVHAEGGVIFAQLAHAGIHSGKQHELGYLVGASAFAPLRADEHVHELTIPEIGELVEAYATAARHVRDGGVDGVEVHMGHGNILQQFLSPLTNIRTDEYGTDDAGVGDGTGRMLFPAQVIMAVAAAVPELEMSWRISADELIPGGLELANMITIVRSLMEITGVTPSILNVSAGQDIDPLSAGLHQSAMYLPLGHLVPLAAAFKKEFPELVINCIGRIVEPEHAEQVLANGETDLVGMTRAHIADPYLVSKISSGQRLAINPCIGCNIGCLGRLENGTHITCIGNPASGREARLTQVAIATRRPRTVVIIGGGPTGLEAAVRAGQQGHNVRLFERGNAVGGLVSTTRRLPGRGETGKISDYRRDLLATLKNVTISTGVEATAEDIASLVPDFVVVATGTRRGSVDGLTGEWITGWDAMQEDEPESTEQTQVVFDDHGDVLGASIAEYLALRGHPTTLVYRSAKVMPNVERGTRAVVQTRLAAAGVEIITNVQQPPKLNTERGVLVGRRTSLNTLGAELAALGIPHTVVGDAAVPRGLEHAMLEGRLAIDEHLVAAMAVTSKGNHVVARSLIA